MAKCGFCGSTIVMGGKREGELRFCNDRCYQRGVLLTVADQVPEEVVQRHLYQVHSGLCPKCQGSGPVDVHTSHRVWSALIVTTWSSRPQICCRSCGIKSKIGDALYSLFLGWWGIPWGLFMTPIQLVRNLTGLFSSPDPMKPSKRLETMIRLDLAANMARENQVQ